MNASYSDPDREAIYRVIAERRDIRTGFRPDPIPDAVLTRILAAGHAAPSVGMAQPWDFVVVRSPDRRRRMQEEVRRAQDAYTATLPASRAASFGRLRTDAIARAPVSVAVTCDATRGGWYTLGAPDGSEGLTRSVGYAIENMLLVARAEGIGVCLLGAFGAARLGPLLELPAHLEVMAWLCLGYLDRFPPAAGLALTGWARGRPLEWVVHDETFGRRGLPGREPARLLEETIAGLRSLNGNAGDGEHGAPAARVADRLASLGTPAPAPHAVLVLFAGDPAGSGGSAGPVVREILAGGAGPGRLVATTGIEVCVVDLGLRDDLPCVPGLLPRRFPDRPVGLTRQHVVRAVETGIEIARDYYASGNGWLLGDVLTGDDDLASAISARLMDGATDALEVLAACDGLEVAALAGFIVGARALRAPVVLCGPGAAAATLVASALAPASLAACFPVGRVPADAPDPFGHLGLPVLLPELSGDLADAAAVALPFLRAAAEGAHQTESVATGSGTR